MTIRFLKTLFLGILFAATVGAQGPNALRPQQRHELFKRNREVIGHVVSQTLESSRVPSNYLKQADSYYKLLFEFNQEIRKARDAKDMARVTELSNNLEMLLDGGLAYVLEETRKQVENGTGREEYPRIKNDLLAQLDSLLFSLDDDSKAKTSLSAAKQRLLNISDKNLNTNQLKHDEK